jgi:hypothetical protein
MPDITMCDGKNCDLSLTCYRYTAKPNEYRQSYFTESPIENGECEHYWEDPKERSRKLMKLKNGYKEKL